MLQKIQNEIILSTVVAGSVGISTYFLLNLSWEQALFVSLLLGLFSFIILFINNLFFKQPKTVYSGVSEEEYRLLEKKFEAVSDAAEQCKIENKTTELFLASMSHEIRTPLNGIIGLTEVLDDTPLTKEQKEFVSMIRESSNNLRVIVNDILDVSKINAGKMELESIPFNLFGKIEASVGIFTSKIDEKGILLNLFTDPEIPQQVMGDPTRLSQVIINLVSNAIKFTDNNGKIDVLANYISQTDESVTFKISVGDSGIGLTEEQQQKIFEAYSQADASTNRKSGGTGLGLTISSKIVRSMGGELQVESKEGEGSTFFFILTLPKVESVPEEEDYSTLRVGVLLADEPENSQCSIILKKYIESYDAYYTEYEKEELSSLSAPDILLVDYKMLDETMREALADIACKGVVLVSSTQQIDLERERELFDDILYMPVTLEKIGALVKEEEEIVAIPEQETEKEKKEKKKFSDLSVLVAEDNPINQKLIKIVLENLGLTVTLVENGQEAYESRINNAYDMIFMDIQMPVMGGVESMHAILKYEEENGLTHIPIIALTANALPGDRERYISEGMDDYATKPLEVKALESLITQYCNMERS